MKYPMVLNVVGTWFRKNTSQLSFEPSDYFKLFLETILSENDGSLTLEEINIAAAGGGSLLADQPIFTLVPKYATPASLQIFHHSLGQCSLFTGKNIDPMLRCFMQIRSNKPLLASNPNLYMNHMMQSDTCMGQHTKPRLGCNHSLRGELPRFPLRTLPL